MMRAVGREGGREGPDPNPMLQKTIVICSAQHAMRDQIATDQPGPDRDCPLATRPFWQLALVAGNSVEPTGLSETTAQRPADPNLVDKFSDFLHRPRAPAVGQVAACRGVAPGPSASPKGNERAPDPSADSAYSVL